MGKLRACALQSIPGLFSTPTQMKRPGYEARVMVTPDTGRIPLRILNPRSEAVFIRKGEEIAAMQPLPREAVSSGVIATTRKPEEVSKEKKQVLWKMINSTNNQLTEPEKEQLYAVLMEYADLFAVGSDDLGRTSKIKHEINTGDAAPIRQQV